MSEYFAQKKNPERPMMMVFGSYDYCLPMTTVSLAERLAWLLGTVASGVSSAVAVLYVIVVKAGRSCCLELNVFQLNLATWFLWPLLYGSLLFVDETHGVGQRSCELLEILRVDE